LKERAFLELRESRSPHLIGKVRTKDLETVLGIVWAHV
jgi:hypothetical protein